jgi:hypothetical protein
MSFAEFNQTSCELCHRDTADLYLLDVEGEATFACPPCTEGYLQRVGDQLDFFPMMENAS